MSLKWDYCVVKDEINLNHMGEKGWELVSTINQNNQLNYILKKPKASFTERITLEQREKVYEQLKKIKVGEA